MRKARRDKLRGRTKIEGAGLKLLVVEDSGDLVITLKALFALIGHRTRFVTSVAGALAAAKAEVFDVLLSDIGLPDGTGWELLRQLQETGHPPLYAIAMSGYGLDGHLCESAAAGFELHLIKPVDPEVLVTALDRISTQSKN